MVRAGWSRSAWVVVALVGCSGVIGDPGSTEQNGPPPGFDTPTPAIGAPLSPEIRLLSGDEYRATIVDLLGLEASATIAHGETGAGYDTGAEGRLDENLFGTLLLEAERLAAQFVAGPMTDAYPCVAPTVRDEACIAGVIEDLGLRAYRRPLDDEEQATLLGLYLQIGESSSDWTLATESLVTRLLTSIHFLHRTELGTRDGARSLLSPWERASLLSYTLTGSMPDDALFAAAAADELDEEGVREQVRRLLATEAGQERVAAYLSQWLRLGVLDEMAADPGDFPKLDDPALGPALRDEFRTYVDATVLGDDGAGTLRAFLTADFVFVNEHTAPLYGLSSSSAAFESVPFGDERRGVFGLASVMAAHASVGDPDKDRPVIRGLLIKNQLLCETVGLPSGIDTAQAAMQATGDLELFEQLTTREQFETIMNQDQQCMDCHVQFMPFGFLFGHFDALGRFRTEKGVRTIDTAVDEVLVHGAPRSYDDHLALLDELAPSDIVSECFARNLAAYVAGTPNGPVLDRLTAVVTDQADVHGGDIRRQLEALLSAPALYERSWDPALVGGMEETR